MVRHLILALFLAAGQSLLAQGIEFIHEDLAAAKEQAAEQDKLIFIDAYTTWCGPCKRLAKNIFPEAEAGSFFNKHFVNLKMDMEKGDGPAFAREYKIKAYPTLLVIDAEGKEVERVVGAPKMEQFLAFGRSAAGKQDKSGAWALKYENGDRSYDTYYNYIMTLNEAGKSSTRITNEYLRTQTDFKSAENIALLAIAFTEVDSRAFELFEQHKKAIKNSTDKEKLQKRVESALDNTAEKAIQYEMLELIEEARTKGLQHAQEYTEKQYPHWINNYYKKVPDPRGYYIALDEDWDAQDLLNAGQVVQSVYYNQKKLRSKMISLLEGKEDDLKGLQQYYMTLGMLYWQQDNDHRSQEILKNGKAYLEEQKLPFDLIDKILKKQQG